MCFDAKPYFVSSFNKLLAAQPKYNSRINLKWMDTKLSADTASCIKDSADAICTFVEDKIDAAVVKELQRAQVEMVAVRAAGYDNIDVSSCDAAGITICRVPTYSPSSVAEHAVALFMTLNRKIHHAYNRVRDQNFALHGLVGMNIKGKTVGVIGTGSIGSEFCRIMLGFGCRILCYDVVKNEALAGVKGITYAALDEVLSQADIISLHVPLLPSTRHIINAANINRMKRGAYLINTSRGALVESKALIDGLKSGHIAGACLDVYELERGLFFEDLSEELIPDDNILRLIGMPNVLITAHQAFLTHEALEAIATTTFNNILDVFDNNHRMSTAQNSINKVGPVQVRSKL